MEAIVSIDGGRQFATARRWAAAIGVVSGVVLMVPAEGRAGPPAAPEVVEAAAPAGPAVAFERAGQIWVTTPGGEPRATALRPSATYTATVGVGSSEPLLSPDGRWVAYVDDELVVASLDPPGRPTMLTSVGRPGAVWIEIGGWSPDGRRLVYHLGRPATAEGLEPPLPKGTTLGFFLWDRGGGPPRALPWLEGFSGWTPDGRAVLDAHLVQDSAEVELRRVSLDDGAVTVLARSDDTYGFGELTVGATRVVYTSRGAVWVAPLAEPTKAREVVRGAFAEYQSPRSSPDERLVLWVHRRRAAGAVTARLEVGTVGGAAAVQDLGPLDGPQRADWLDDGRILVCAADGLSLRALSGEVTRLAGPGACFVRRRAP